MNDDSNEFDESILIEQITFPQPVPELVPKPSNHKKRPLQNYQCEICQKIFPAASNLRKHKQIHSEKRPYNCIECGKCFKTSSNLLKHLKQVHKHESKYKKNPLNKASKPKLDESKSELKNEQKQMVTKREPKYACDMSDKIYRSNYDLKSHQMTHTDERPFECWICHKRLRRKDVLKKHMEIHTEMPRIECTTCNKRFRTMANYNSHARARHGKVTEGAKSIEPPVRRFTCELCGFTFTQRGGLVTHMKTAHSDRRPHKCEICGKGFKIKLILTSHLKTHTKLEYKCSECGKEFRKEVSLRNHMEYHTGSVVKPFFCDICYKSFRLKFNLMEHQRIHTGEKPYHCEHCGAHFRTMSSFYNHLKKEHGISVSARKLEEQARVTAMS